MHLNYPRSGVPVGKYLGPNTTGEYFTVVSNDSWTEPTGDGLVREFRRVGLAYGCYMIDGQATDTDGFPPDVALAKLQTDWQALKTPRRLKLGD